MGRVFIVTIILLLLGVLTTIAVAWGCAAWVNNHALVARSDQTFGYGTGHADYEEWLVTRKPLRGYEEITSFSVDPGVEAINFGFRDALDPEDVLPGWLDHFAPSSTNGVPGWHAYSAHTWGWPVPALWWEMSGDSVGSAAPHSDVRGHGIAIAPVTRKLPHAVISATRVLPVRPIWTGIVIDTLFYAALWLPVYILLLLLLRMMQSARGRRRLRRGQCPQCRYTLCGTAHGRCPECGVALPVSQARIGLGSGAEAPPPHAQWSMGKSGGVTH